MLRRRARPDTLRTRRRHSSTTSSTGSDTFSSTSMPAQAIRQAMSPLPTEKVKLSSDARTGSYGAEKTSPVSSSLM